MIGNLILNYCLNRSGVNSITSITRKKTGIVHPKLIEVLNDNFLDFT